MTIGIIGAGSIGATFARQLAQANNPIVAPPFQLAELHGRLSTEVFADYVPGARVVKAFNHLPAKLLGEDPRTPGGRRVLFFAGTDASAKAEVAALIDKLGFFGIDRPASHLKKALTRVLRPLLESGKTDEPATHKTPNPCSLNTGPWEAMKDPRAPARSDERRGPRPCRRHDRAS